MNNKPLQDDEFDIEALIYKLFLLFKKGIRWILTPILLMFKQPKRLIIIISILFIGAITIRYTVKPVYKSYFTLKPTNLGDLYFIGMLDDLVSLIEDDDIEGISDLLRIDNSLSEKLIKLDFATEKINHFYKYSDSINSLSIFIYTSDRGNFDTLQRAIHSYLEQSPYYSKSRNIRMENINEMERRLNRDMAGIDSLKRILTTNAGPRSAGGFVYGEPINPMNVFEKAILLYKEQLLLNYQKKYTSSFELVKNCVSTKKRYWPRLSILLPAALALALCVNLILNISAIIKTSKP